MKLKDSDLKNIKFSIDRSGFNASKNYAKNVVSDALSQDDRNFFIAELKILEKR